MGEGSNIKIYIDSGVHRLLKDISKNKKGILQQECYGYHQNHISKLIRYGLIDRSIYEYDKRKNILHMTQKGKKVLNLLEQKYNK